MKKISIDEWEKKYIAKPIKRFDQRNRMTIRAEWDPECGETIGKALFHMGIKDEPGYQPWDFSLSNAAVTAGRFTGTTGQAETLEKLAKQSKIDNIPNYNVKTDTFDPKKAAQYIKKLAVYFGADLVGICKLDQRWIYSHSYTRLEHQRHYYPNAIIGESKPIEIPEIYQYAVSIAVNQDYNLLKYSPTKICYSSNLFAYTRLINTNNMLSAFIQTLGFNAFPLPTHQIARHIPIAMQAGLGENGRNGLLITPEFGPRVKVTSLITNLPLAIDSPIDFGVTDVCSKCKKCAEVCPAQALSYDERSAEPNDISNSAGELKWRVKAVKCAEYWVNGHQGCNTCVACCPFNNMEESFNNAGSLKPDSFWDEWNPIPYAANGTQPWNK